MLLILCIFCRPYYFHTVRLEVTLDVNTVLCYIAESLASSYMLLAVPLGCDQIFADRHLSLHNWNEVMTDELK